MKIGMMDNSMIRPAMTQRAMNDGSFARLLSSAHREASSGDAGRTQDQKLRQSAEQFVGLAFVLPVLKMAREDPFKSDLFHGGSGEDMFGAQMDEMMADHIAGSMANDLVRSIERRFMLNQESPRE